MTTSIRSTFAAATALGLVSFVTSSAVFAGLFASPTLVGFSLLAVYGVAEIAALSYATPHVRTARRVAAPVATRRRVPAVVEYPVPVRAACRALAA